MSEKTAMDISPEQIELSLRTLRHSYQTLLEEFDRCREYAKLQLSQVELLLSVAAKNGKMHDLSTKTPLSKPLINGTAGQKTKGRRRERVQGLKFSKPYQSLTMHEAIAKILKDKGGAVDTDTIVYELYGQNLTPEQFKVAKDRVTKSLSKGKQEGKWYRLPDRAGVYTASLEY
ncbi:MAG: hypothetical protein ACK421_02315 [Pseudanabaenaceae cyanobacterium]